MKRKLLAMILALCLILSLTACNSVDEVEAAIDAIGTVTMESGDAIQSAKLQYDSLSQSQKEQVENADVLHAAVAEYARLTAALDTAVSAINAIGFVDLNSGDAIALARMAYDALEADGLTDYAADYAPVLIQAEESYAMMYVEKAYKDATSMYDLGDYANAEVTLADAVSRFPNAPKTPQCQELAASCVAKIAKDMYNHNDVENAYYTLVDGEALYGATDETQAVLTNVIAALTSRRPVNTVLKTSLVSGKGQFTVNASDFDACIKLESVKDASKYMLFFVRAGETYTVYVPDGSYVVKYTTGEYWFGLDSLFGRNASFTQADDIFTFETTTSGGYIYYDSITITLYTVVDGNLETNDIPADEF